MLYGRKGSGGLCDICEWNLDAIGITGQLPRANILQANLKRAIEFIAPVYVYPGEFEMEGLAMGG